MKKLMIVIFALTTLPGCASLGEVVMAGVQDAGVTGSARLSAKSCSEIRNQRGAVIRLAGNCSGEIIIFSN